MLANLIRGRAEGRSTFAETPFPTMPLYSGNPWFLPMVGAWYRTRDWWDRATAR